MRERIFHDSQTKRFLFAEEIRGRNRSQILQNMRQQFKQDEQCFQMVQNLPASLDILYHYSKSRPDRCRTIAEYFYKWARTNPNAIEITDRICSVHYGDMITLTLSCENLLLDEFWGMVLRVFEFQASLQGSGLKVFFTIMTQTINHLQNFGHKMQPIDQFLCRVDLAKCPQAIGTEKEQFQFYVAAFVSKIPYVFKFLLDEAFLNNILQILVYKIDYAALLSLDIKLLVLLTFYDNRQDNQTNLYLTGLTDKLSDMGLLRNISFLLQFLTFQNDNNRRLLINLCSLIINISENIGSQLLLEEQFLSSLKEIINKFTGNNIECKINVCLAFLNLMKNVQGSRREMDIIKENDGVDMGLRIIEELGEVSKDIMGEGVETFRRLLDLGQERKEQERLDVNPLALKIRTAGGREIIRKYEDFFQGFLCYFD